MTERVVEAIAGWAQDAGHAVDAAQHATLRDELAALVMTQRATFATPVRLNAGLAEHPLTSACFRSTAATLGPFAEFERNREPMLQVIGRHAAALDRLGGKQPEEVLRAARREWTRALELGREADSGTPRLRSSHRPARSA